MSVENAVHPVAPMNGPKNRKYPLLATTLSGLTYPVAAMSGFLLGAFIGEVLRGGLGGIAFNYVNIAAYSVSFLAAVSIAIFADHPCRLLLLLELGLGTSVFRSDTSGFAILGYQLANMYDFLPFIFFHGILLFFASHYLPWRFFPIARLRALAVAEPKPGSLGLRWTSAVLVGVIAAIVGFIFARAVLFLIFGGFVGFDSEYMPVFRSGPVILFIVSFVALVVAYKVALENPDMAAWNDFLVIYFSATLCFLSSQVLLSVISYFISLVIIGMVTFVVYAVRQPGAAQKWPVLKFLLPKLIVKGQSHDVVHYEPPPETNQEEYYRFVVIDKVEGETTCELRAKRLSGYIFSGDALEVYGRKSGGLVVARKVISSLTGAVTQPLRPSVFGRILGCIAALALCAGSLTTIFTVFGCSQCDGAPFFIMFGILIFPFGGTATLPIYALALFFPSLLKKQT